MELTRVAKRSFQVTEHGQALGLVQRSLFGQQWSFHRFEGCGISSHALTFRNLRDLKPYVAYSLPPSTSSD
jgi:hypothetical protein